ncbi:response regulator [Hyphomicrobium sp.]|jgi:DNA-binding response OmpR family regulator|uniref:response regulator n=1 Tax=Hyphomicrobium sp. TaxID=82 RepID=UPI002C0E9B47|nr:response regulator [Hyphomicrobium sp.]HVZ04629.1 response regulator [Hyphomicrobium sp.]
MASYSSYIADRQMLVIHDDLARQIALMLRQEGSGRVDIALDGLEGIECLSRQSYDIILLNYKMPRMNGAEMLRRIRQRGDRTPVIFVSAWDEYEIPEKISDLAYDAWINTPYSHRHFVETIASTLHKHGR